MVHRLALLPIVAAMSTAASAQAPGAAAGAFAAAPEKALVENSCTACHAAEQVTAQRHGKAEWAAIVDKMIGFGADVPHDKYDAIVNYLATHYPEAAKP